MTALKEKVIETIEYWQTMKEEPFKNEDCIPELPILSIEEMKKYVWPKLYKRGAVAKKDLIVGHKYLGRCRNAHEAVWKDNDTFEYQRYKFGFTYPDKVNHFEDDNGYDVFIPIKDLGLD